MSDLTYLAKTVGKFAGLLGSVLGLPGSEAIINLIASLFEADSQQIPEFIQKIQNDPNASQKLIDFENQNKDKLNELLFNHANNQMQYEHQMKLASMADTQDARKYRDWMSPFLGVVVTLGFFAIILAVIFDVTPNNDTTISIMLGNLSTAWISIITFYFGSSVCSKRKDELLSKK